MDIHENAELDVRVMQDTRIVRCGAYMAYQGTFLGLQLAQRGTLLEAEGICSVGAAGIQMFNFG